MCSAVAAGNIYIDNIVLYDVNFCNGLYLYYEGIVQSEKIFAYESSIDADIDVDKEEL